MSIASEIQRIKNNISAAYTACERKGASMPQLQNSNNLANTIDRIPQGESAGIQPKYVNFIDTDGTILYSKTEAEVQALSSMPPLPDKAGYTYQSWNWTLPDIKAYGFPLNVGAVRVPSDGMTHLMFHLLPQEDMTVSIPFILTSGCELTIDWGDGEMSVYTSSPATHTYLSDGVYRVRIGSIDDFGLDQLSDYTSIRLIKAEFGIHSQINANVFYNCYALNEVSFPDTIRTIGSNAFYNCNSLNHVIIPSGCTEIGDSAFSNCRGLQRVSCPKNVFCDANCFNGCSAIESISIPDNTNSEIQNRLFFGCRGLQRVFIPACITLIHSQAFYNSVNLRYIDLSALTAVPVLENPDAFYAIHRSRIFYVRNAQMQQAFESAANWSVFNGAFFIGGVHAEI